MREVELVSEIMVAFVDGMQDKKSTINNFYEAFDEDFPRQGEIESRFREVIDFIAENLNEVVPATKFTRVPLFLLTLPCDLPREVRVARKSLQYQTIRLGRPVCRVA